MQLEKCFLSNAQRSAYILPHCFVYSLRTQFWAAFEIIPKSNCICYTSIGNSFEIYDTPVAVPRFKKNIVTIGIPKDEVYFWIQMKWCIYLYIAIFQNHKFIICFSQLRDNRTQIKLQKIPMKYLNKISYLAIPCLQAAFVLIPYIWRAFFRKK